MSIDNALRTAIGFFALILVGSLVSALIGGLFALLIAAISPEFVQDLFHNSDDNIKGYAFAVGMIWGLFIGAGASAFAAGLGAIIKMLRIRLEFKKGLGGQNPTPPTEE